MKLDCIATIEACYAPAPTDEEWLANVAATLRPLVREVPAAGYTFSVTGDGFRIGAIGVRDADARARYRSRLARWEAMDPAARRWHAAVPAVDLATRRMARLPQELAGSVKQFFDGAGVKDALGLAAVEPDGNGVTLTVPYFEPERLSPRVLHRLRRVTAHLGTALRLRRRTFEPPSPHDERTEAVLDPDGRVLHATGPAREAPARESLARAVRAVEQARGRLRETSADQALALWDALVSGRWSVIDHAEADGRRLVLIRRNEPGARDPRALAPGERDVVAFAALGHSNKHIAYLLGLSPTTVATHLSRALAKLGLRSRRDLIAMFGQGAPHSDSPA